MLYFSWYVCAGVVIAREAGGKVSSTFHEDMVTFLQWNRLTDLCLFTVHSKKQVYGRKGGKFDENTLMGHHFFVIRAIAGNEKEKSEEIQDRLTREFFETIEDWDV